MTTYIIRNGVPSADEMGKRLGLTKKRVASVRVIMNSPSSPKRSSGKSRTTAKKNVKRTAARKSGR